MSSSSKKKVKGKAPKGYRRWVDRLKWVDTSIDGDGSGHYAMEYDAADGYTGKQIMEYIAYMKAKGKRSCLIGTDFVYCLMDRIAVLEAKS